MATMQSVIRELGGIASTAELVRRGYEPDSVLLFAEYGQILRIRKGWYANNDVDESVIRAVRVGGKLACLSALAFYGLCEPPSGELHVSVPSSAARLRSPGNPKKPFSVNEKPRVIVHWSGWVDSGNRQTVSIGEAVAQARGCGARDIL